MMIRFAPVAGGAACPGPEYGWRLPILVRSRWKRSGFWLLALSLVIIVQVSTLEAGSGWGSPVSASGDPDISPSQGHDAAFGGVGHPSRAGTPTNGASFSLFRRNRDKGVKTPDVVSTRARASGWGSPDISPGRGLLDNPWFKASEFVPDPDQYKAPPAKDLQKIRDNIANPELVDVETVEKDGRKQRAAFSAMMVDSRLYVPTIVLPKMFGVKIEWNAAARRLRILNGSRALVFTLEHGLQVMFFGDEVDLGSKLYYYQRMLWVSADDIAQFFRYKAYWAAGRGLLHFVKRTSAPAKLKKKWKATLRRHHMDRYTRKLIDVSSRSGRGGGQARPGEQGLSGRSRSGAVFRNIWATSEEPQRIASRGLRGDWYLRADDLACALPSRKALMKRVRIRYGKTGRTVTATVVDVGPWNIDDPYWLKTGGRPEVEKTIYDRRGRKSNLAGIDLSYGLWHALGVSRGRAYGGMFSDYVDWWFQ